MLRVYSRPLHLVGHVARLKRNKCVNNGFGEAVEGFSWKNMKEMGRKR